MSPLFMPARMDLQLLRAFTLFNGTIMAEVFRGGFQASQRLERRRAARPR